MNKKGFTLVELLVVIVIIGVLSIIIIPSVLNINSSINERLYSDKKEKIETAAQLYANNHEELFNGTSQVKIFVSELVKSNYFTADQKTGSSNCQVKIESSSNLEDNNDTDPAVGCVINPTNKKSMNHDYVILTKQGAGVTAQFYSVTDGADADNLSGSSRTLVTAVCNMFEGDKGQTMSGSNVVGCHCVKGEGDEYVRIVDANNNPANACLFSGTSPNNYLKYGASSANWRVLGVYQIATDTLSAKMITMKVVD